MKSPYSLEIARWKYHSRCIIWLQQMSIKDQYQDYDILYTFLMSINLMSVLKQSFIFIPSEHYPNCFRQKRFLMLFEDDTRIDLTICTLQTFHAKHRRAIPKVPLDKDNVIRCWRTTKKAVRIKPIDENSFTEASSLGAAERCKRVERDELSYAMFIRIFPWIC